MSAAEHITASIADSTASIDAADWDRVAGLADSHANPFLSHAFFLALEQSGCAVPRTGWKPQHVVLRDTKGAIQGIMPLFQKAHSQGEYVFDHGWANAFEQAGGAYYPKLQSAIPFTPVTAPKLLAEVALRPALAGVARELVDRHSLSSAHATFLSEADAGLLQEKGWLLRTDTQYHWHNEGFASFEEYLGTLSSRHRKVMRRERREAVEGLEVRWFSGNELTEGLWDAFFAFYEDTGNRKWGRPYLNRRFFSLLSAAMADSVVLMMAFDGDEAVAGTLSLKGRERLYGRYWGATRNVPFLHFELCYYQAIDYAIGHRLSIVEAGAQGEHKLARGYAPTTTVSAHWIAHEGLRAAVSRFVRQERAAVEREQEALATLTPFRKG